MKGAAPDTTGSGPRDGTARRMLQKLAVRPSPVALAQDIVGVV